MSNRKRALNHPVWDVYNLYRTVRLNVKYYSEKLSKLQRINLVIEIVLAAIVPSSAIAVLWFWETSIGKNVWQYVVALAALIAFIKPFLALTERIRKHEEMLTGYRALESDLKKTVVLINQDRKYDETHRARLMEAWDKRAEIELKSPVINPGKNWMQRAMREVERELPAEFFYMPEEV